MLVFSHSTFFLLWFFSVIQGLHVSDANLIWAHRTNVISNENNNNSTDEKMF